MYSSWRDKSQKLIHLMLFAWFAFISEMWRNHMVGCSIKSSWRWTVETSNGVFVGVLPWCKAHLLPGEVWHPVPDLVLTLSLPEWTRKLSKNLAMLSQLCQHVYCMTILQEEFWCFVIFEHVFVWPVSKLPHPHPTQLPEPGVDKEPCPSLFYNIWLPVPDALSTYEVVYFENGCCGDCVWYYCSYLSF